MRAEDGAPRLVGRLDSICGWAAALSQVMQQTAGAAFARAVVMTVRVIFLRVMRQPFFCLAATVCVCVCVRTFVSAVTPNCLVAVQQQWKWAIAARHLTASAARAVPALTAAQIRSKLLQLDIIEQPRSLLKRGAACTVKFTLIAKVDAAWALHSHSWTLLVVVIWSRATVQNTPGWDKAVVDVEDGAAAQKG